MGRRRAAAWMVRMVAVAMAAGLAFPSAGGAAIPATSHPVDVAVQAANGSGRVSAPGLGCADGGEGASWHYEWSAAVPVGAAALGPVATELLVHLDLHSDLVRQPNVRVEGQPAPAGPTAFLLGDESTATLANERGTVALILRSGSCAAPTLGFDGSAVSGAGSWAVDHGTGAYRAAAGSGTFTLAGTVDPGADNPLDLRLTGAITNPNPALGVDVVSTYWGGLGVDYLTRRPTVVYRITNTGTGDAFGARLTGITSPTNGVRVLGPTTSAPVDLAAGASTTVAVRFELGLADPCRQVLLGCRFTSELTVQLPDAFGTPHPSTATVPVAAPTLPPPL